MDELKIRCGIKIEGKLRIDHYKRGGFWYSQEQKNIIVNGGLQLIINLLKGKDVSPSHIEFGTSNAAEDATHTTLQTTIPGALVEENQGQSRFFDDGRGDIEKAIVDNQTVRFVRTLGFGASNLNTEAGTGEIFEAGLFNRFTGGTMFSRVVLENSFNKSFDTQHSATWEIKISRDTDFGGNNTIVDTGLEIVRDVLFQRDDESKGSEHYPFYLNFAPVGTNGQAPTSSETQLVAESTDADGRLKITRHDRTESGDPDFDLTAPKLIIQREIPDTMFLSDVIKEAALFNQHTTTVLGGTKVLRQKMFSRVVFDGIPAATQKTLTWEIIITRT